MKLIAAVDLSRASSYIIEAVHRVAMATDAEVVLLYVVEPIPTVPVAGFEPAVGYADVPAGPPAEPEQLTALVEQLREVDISASARVRQGDPASTVLEEAGREGAELIVVGSHGRGLLFDALLGSVSAKILRHTEIPVLVVPVRGL